MSKFLTYSKIENGEFISIQVNEHGLVQLDIERSRGRDRHEKYLAPHAVNELFTRFERSGWVHMQHMGSGLISLGAGIEGTKPRTKSVDSFFLSGELQEYVDMFERILVDTREEMSWRNANRRFYSHEPEENDDIDLGWIVAPVVAAFGIIASQTILLLVLLALGIGAYSATENLMVIFPLLIVGLVGGLATYVGSGVAIGYWCRVDAIILRVPARISRAAPIDVEHVQVERRQRFSNTRGIARAVIARRDHMEEEHGAPSLMCGGREISHQLDAIARREAHDASLGAAFLER